MPNEERIVKEDLVLDFSKKTIGETEVSLYSPGPRNRKWEIIEDDGDGGQTRKHFGSMADALSWLKMEKFVYRRYE